MKAPACKGPWKPGERVSQWQACKRPGGDAGECLGPDPVVRPDAALVAVQQPGVVQHLQVVADGGWDRSKVGLASIEERDTTCCYARQDKFWVEGTPDAERWEVYTVLADSQSFWGEDDGQGWAAVEASLEAGASETFAHSGKAQCCGTQEGAGQSASSASCCS